MSILNDINWLAVLVAIISNMVLGMLWYSPILFGNLWTKLIDKKPDELMQGRNKAMIGAILNAIVMAFILAVIVTLTKSNDLLQGILLGVAIGICISTLAINNYLFEGRKLKLCLIDAGFSFFAAIIMTVIITILK